MRSEQERDAQTVTIATTLVLFTAVLALILAAVGVAAWVFDASDSHGQVFLVAVVMAAGVSGRYLLRHGSR